MRTIQRDRGLYLKNSPVKPAIPIANKVETGIFVTKPAWARDSIYIYIYLFLARVEATIDKNTAPSSSVWRNILCLKMNFFKKIVNFHKMQRDKKYVMLHEQQQTNSYSNYLNISVNKR